MKNDKKTKKELNSVRRKVNELEKQVAESKRGEEALESSERKFRTIFDKANDGMFLVDLEARKLYMCNAMCVKMLGHSQEEFSNLDIADIHPGEDLPFIYEQIRKFGTGEEGIPSEIRFKRKDGSIFPSYLSPSLVTIAEKEYLLIIFKDITESKRAEREISMLAFALKSINECVSITDMDDTILFVNRSFLETYGYRENELLGKNMSIVRSPKNSPEILGDILSSTVRGEWHGEIWNRRKDGTEFPISLSTTIIRGEDAKPIALIGIATDITKRKRSEEALRMSEEKYRALFEESIDAVFTSTPAGEFTDINLSGVRLFGYGSKEEMLNLRVAEDLFWNRDDRKKYQALMHEQGFVKDYEMECKTKDGKKLIVLETANAIRDAHGNIIAYRGIIRDITVQKHLEKQFLRAQRMESIGTLAGGVAHDLNNVLAPIMMAVEVLQSKFSDEESKRILDTLATSAKRGSDIVKQILAFGRGVEGDRIIIQPKHIIREVERIATETFPKSIQLKTLIPKNLWTILADPTQIHQVLLNICVNARDAMPKGGVLSVSAENFHVDEYYAKMNIEAREGPYVVATVADTGTGIPRDIMDHVFDPFFTTKDLGKGTGLGLSTALGIVRSHGGFINVYSEMGKGTSFKVYLPARLKEQEAIQGTESPKLPPGKGELILVVDDEASIREIAKLTLEANGYQVVTANDGVEAVSIFARDMGKIRLVLMDMMMPGMDGPATILAMQMMKISAKIVATSGETSRERNVMESLPGVSAFLKKPYTAEKLLTTLHDVLKEA